LFFSIRRFNNWSYIYIEFKTVEDLDAHHFFLQWRQP
jgi:hypothetical protein